MADTTETKAPAKPEKVDTAAARALAEKGDGVLTKVGNVWSYPGAPMDRSGTNLRLPVEFVTDAEVQAAIQAEEAHASVLGFGGEVSAVRFGEAGTITAIGVHQIGTSEAGTELPPNSRPTHDAARALPGEPTAPAPAVEGAPHPHAHRGPGRPQKAPQAA